MQSRAFTLTDLVIVVVLLIVLAAIFLPATDFFNSDGRMPRSSCASNLKQIYNALPSGFKGKAESTPGTLSVRPGTLSDSVLIPNRQIDLEKWNRRP